jgi:hypothetical protein
MFPFFIFSGGGILDGIPEEGVSESKQGEEGGEQDEYWLHIVIR